MSKNIKLHPKHGLNPSIDICFYCGKEKGIVLLEDKCKNEAPKQTVINYEPCDECSARWGKGTAIIEVSKTPYVENQPPLPQPKNTPNVYPSGRYLVIKRQNEKIALMLSNDFQEIVKKHIGEK